jgi:hypothetical protein
MVLNTAINTTFGHGQIASSISQPNIAPDPALNTWSHFDPGNFGPKPTGGGQLDIADADFLAPNNLADGMDFTFDVGQDDIRNGAVGR